MGTLILARVVRGLETIHMQSALFTNFSDSDFTWRWDGVDYTFKAGQSVYLEDYKHAHFTKHLVDRELQRQGKGIDDHSRQALVNNCGGPATGPEKPAGIVASEVVDLNARAGSEPAKARFCDSCDSKGGFHRKDCPKNTRKEEAFEGLWE